MTVYYYVTRLTVRLIAEQSLWIIVLQYFSWVVTFQRKFINV